MVLPDGRRAIRDASGVAVPLAQYRRIASASVVADQVLFELCEPERLIAVTQQSKDNARFGYRHQRARGDRLAVRARADPRALARSAVHQPLRRSALRGAPARARHRGVRPRRDARGRDALAEHPRDRRADRRAASVPRPARPQLRASASPRVAADIPEAKRPRALFLSAYGTALYGGAAGSSYHDVLHYAGLRNVAAPLYTRLARAERRAGPGPRPGGAGHEAGHGQGRVPHARARAAAALPRAGRIAELDIWLADDPGLPMLDMAEALRAKVHGHSAPNGGIRPVHDPRLGVGPGREQG